MAAVRYIRRHTYRSANGTACVLVRGLRPHSPDCPGARMDTESPGLLCPLLGVRLKEVDVAQAGAAGLARAWARARGSERGRRRTCGRRQPSGPSLKIVNLDSRSDRGDDCGPERHPRAGRLSRRGAGLAGGQQGAGVRRAPVPTRTRTTSNARRAWQRQLAEAGLAGGHLADRVRRPRAGPDRAGDGQPGDLARAGARDPRRDRDRDARVRA